MGLRLGLAEYNSSLFLFAIEAFDFWEKSVFLLAAVSVENECKQYFQWNLWQRAVQFYLFMFEVSRTTFFDES